MLSHYLDKTVIPTNKKVPTEKKHFSRPLEKNKQITKSA
jgi:hypothetical protein